MALKTSELWQKLLRTKGTERQYRFDINGKTYIADSEVKHNVENGLFEELTIGQAASATLTLSLYADNIPKGATIRRYIRLVNGSQVSEWLPGGIFYVNRRALDNGYWTVEAFDVMRKGEQPWNPSQDLNFPCPMDEAAAALAAVMGTTLDSRCNLSHTYTIDYPTSDPESEEPADNNYTVRQILQWIAAAHGGNWIVTGEGKLLLIGIGDEPEETHYLVTEYGDPILFGGVAIYV